MNQPAKKEKPFLTEGPSEKGFYVGIYLEHLEEASFLYEQRLGLFDDPEINWPDIEEFEDRLEAHIDALVVGGELALDVCRMQADAGDFGELHAAVRVFCRQERKEFVQEVLDDIEGDDDERVNGLVDALKHEVPVAWHGWLVDMLSSDDAILIRIASCVIGFQRLPFGSVLADCLQKKEKNPLPDTIRALGRLADQKAKPALLRLVDHADDAISYEAALALLRCGDAQLIHKLARRSGESPRLLILIGIAGTREMTSTLFGMIAKHGPTPESLLALGFLGDVSSMDFLLDQLENEDLAGISAYALNLITGADLYEDVFFPEEIDDDELFEDEREQVEKGEPLNEGREPPGMTISMLCSNPGVWRKWWEENSGSFDAAECHRSGKPATPSSILEILLKDRTPHIVRKFAYEELVIKSGGSLNFETDYPAANQKKALMSFGTKMA